MARDNLKNATMNYLQNVRQKNTWTRYTAWARARNYTSNRTDCPSKWTMKGRRILVNWLWKHMCQKDAKMPLIEYLQGMRQKDTRRRDSAELQETVRWKIDTRGSSTNSLLKCVLRIRRAQRWNWHDHGTCKNEGNGRTRNGQYRWTHRKFNKLMYVSNTEG